MIFEESIGEALYQTAMEAYDLSRIYKAKNDLDLSARYRRKALLLVKEAAFKMIIETDSVDQYMSDLVIVNSAGVAFEYEDFTATRQILQLGSVKIKDEYYTHRAKELLEKTEEKIVISSQPKQRLVGTLVSANLEDNIIQIRENRPAELHSVRIKDDYSKKLIGFYLGNQVIVSIDENQNGELLFCDIQKAA